MNIKDKLLKIIKNKFFIIVCIIVILVTSYIIIEEMMVDNNNEIEIIEEADDIFKKDEEENFEEKCYQMLQMMIAECSTAFEQLPCLVDVEILRNILYAGVCSYIKFRRFRK